MSDSTNGQEAQPTIDAPDRAELNRRAFVVGTGAAAAGATLGAGTVGAQETSDRETTDGSGPSPAVIAHRGYAGLYPENTVGAVEAA